MKLTRRKIFGLAAGAAVVPIVAKLPAPRIIEPLSFDPPMTSLDVVAMRDRNLLLLFDAYAGEPGEVKIPIAEWRRVYE